MFFKIKKLIDEYENYFQRLSQFLPEACNGTGDVGWGQRRVLAQNCSNQESISVWI